MCSFIKSQDPYHLLAFRQLRFASFTPQYMKIISDYGIRSAASRSREYIFDMIERVSEAIEIDYAIARDAQILALRALKNTEIRIVHRTAWSSDIRY
ncbi:MAG: hypothetical protein QXQ39_06285 [Conexivisphaerales archaeon]